MSFGSPSGIEERKLLSEYTEFVFLRLTKNWLRSCVSVAVSDCGAFPAVVSDRWALNREIPLEEATCWVTCANQEQCALLR